MNIKQTKCFMVCEPSHTKSFKVENPEDVLKLLNDELHLDQSPVEKVYCLHLNAQNKVIGYELISQGTHVAAEASPNLIYKGAILANAHSIIISHNHPSGDCKESKEDIVVTKQVIEAGKIIGIPCLDHIIVGNGSYNSFQTKGLM